MPIQTVDVTATLHFADGIEAENVHVVANLQSPSQYADGYVVQKTIKGIVDSNGEVTLSLWPNDLGNDESFYTIEAYDEILGELLKVVAVVPDSTIPLDLEDIAMPVNTFSLACASGNVASIRRVDTTEGLTGGGDLSTNRTHRLDLSTISTEEIEPGTDWIIPVQDPNNPDSIRYARLGNLPGVGVDNFIEFVGTEGQTEIFLEDIVPINTFSMDVIINGKFQCASSYVEESIDIPPYKTKITLDEPLEEGDLVCIRVKRSNPFSSGLPADEITYSGGGTVDDALDALFSATDADPWQETTGDISPTPGNRIFVSTNSGPLTVTLPASPNVGDTIKIIDVTSAAFTGPGNSLINDFTILRNGERIMELEEDLIVDQAKVSIEFIYSGSAIGWIFSE